MKCFENRSSEIHTWFIATQICLICLYTYKSQLNMRPSKLPSRMLFSNTLCGTFDFASKNCVVLSVMHTTLSVTIWTLNAVPSGLRSIGPTEVLARTNHIKYVTWTPLGNTLWLGERNPCAQQNRSNISLIRHTVSQTTSTSLMQTIIVIL